MERERPKITIDTQTRGRADAIIGEKDGEECSLSSDFRSIRARRFIGLGKKSLKMRYWYRLEFPTLLA